MSRFIIFFALVLFSLSFVPRPEISYIESPGVELFSDTIPRTSVEQLIEEWTRMPEEKTWRDSGYYFQLEPVFWRAQRLGTTAGGEVTITALFSSADPSSLRYRGRAIFQFDPALWPEDVTPARGVRGEALIAFPQDVLLCPSPEQEAGLGQNDPYFPLYTTGQIKKVEGSVIYRDSLFLIPMSVQLRDMEIIL